MFKQPGVNGEATKVHLLRKTFFRTKKTFAGSFSSKENRVLFWEIEHVCYQQIVSIMETRKGDFPSSTSNSMNIHACRQSFELWSTRTGQIGWSSSNRIFPSVLVTRGLHYYGLHSYGAQGTSGVVHSNSTVWTGIELFKLLNGSQSEPDY